MAGCQAGGCGPMAAMSVLGTRRFSRRLTTCDVVVGDHAATSGIPGFCHARRCATTGAGPWLWLSRCTSSSASPRRLLEEFLFLNLLTLFALGNMAQYSSTTLYLAVFTSMSGCCVWNAEHWSFQEMTLAVAQCLVRQCLLVLHHYLAFGYIVHIFHVALDSNGEECPVDASVSVLVALLAPGNLEILSRVPRGWRQ